MFREIFEKTYIQPNLKPDYMSSKMFNQLVEIIGLKNASNPVIVRGFIDRNIRNVEFAKMSDRDIADYKIGYELLDYDVTGDIADRMRREWDSQKVAV